MQSTFKIVIVSNNRALPDFKEEHGFSLLLEKDDKKILFDTGQGNAFRENIKKLNIDIKNIDALIISHGHYDHCGNISYIIEQSEHIKTYIHPGATEVRYSIHKDRKPCVKYIGISYENKMALKKSNVNFEPFNIESNIHITGEIPRISSEDTGGPFYHDKEGKVLDKIVDDQSIWIETKEGLVIITGCCHSGLINSVEYIKNISGIDRVQTIIGGLHLNKVTTERVDETIQYINNLHLKNIFPGHCTGLNVIKKFKKELNCHVLDLFAGDEIIC